MTYLHEITNQITWSVVYVFGLMFVSFAVGLAVGKYSARLERR